MFVAWLVVSMYSIVEQLHPTGVGLAHIET